MIGRNGERGSGISTLAARHDDDKTFYYLFGFKVFRREERETQFLSMLTFPSEPHHVWHPRGKLLVSPRRGKKIDLLCPSPNLN